MTMLARLQALGTTEGPTLACRIPGAAHTVS